MFNLFSFWVEPFFLGLAKYLALILLTLILQSSTRIFPESQWAGREVCFLPQSYCGRIQILVLCSTPVWFSNGYRVSSNLSQLLSTLLTHFKLQGGREEWTTLCGSLSVCSRKCHAFSPPSTFCSYMCALLSHPVPGAQ